MLRVNNLTGFGRKYTASGAAFSPSDISGLKLWLAADEIVGLNDTDPVTTWEDLSADNRDATQATAGAKPTYQTNEINALPVVRFDNTDDEMDFTSLVLTDFTIFSVHSIASFGNPAHYVVAGSNQGFFAGIPALSGGCGVYDGTNLRQAQNDITGAICLTATNDQLWENGVEPSYDSSGTLTGLTLSRIGCRTDLSSVRFAGDLAELLIYNSQLGTTDRGNVETYLMNKYGL